MAQLVIQSEENMGDRPSVVQGSENHTSLLRTQTMGGISPTQSLHPHMVDIVVFSILTYARQWLHTP